MKLKLITLCLFLLLTSSIYGVYSHFHQPSCTIPGENLKLGTVEFNDLSSSSNLAKKHFILGLRYLHNFMYPLALREFTIAKNTDPSFPLSYWGIAMSHYWPLWSFVDKAKGLQILNEIKIKNLKMNEIEKKLIDAIQFIYNDGAKQENNKNYLNAMAKLYKEYPLHTEIASFYALALLGYATDNPFDKNNATYLIQARQILKKFIKTHPSHAGMIHYLTHATDIPNSSIPKEGLIATPLIYKYMNDSSHVLHMPSHLYTELGMWSEAAKANQLSIDASNRMCRFLESQNIQFDTPVHICSSAPQKKIKWSAKNWYACDADNIYHSAEWLHYDYLQLGEYEKAAKLVDEMTRVVNIQNEPMYEYWLYRIKARQIIFTEDWQALESLPKPITKNDDDIYWAAYSESGLLLAEGLKAIHHQQIHFINLIDQRYQAILKILDQRSEGGFRDACRLMYHEFLAANEMIIQGNEKRSLHLMEKALAIQEKLDHSEQSLTLPFIPAQEFYATLLMQHPTAINLQKTLSMLKKALIYNPNRAPSKQKYAKVETLTPPSSH